MADQPQDPILNAKCKWILEKSLLDINTTRWAARRHMAWVSLFCIIAFTLIFMFLVPPASLVALAPVISWIYLSLTSIVGIFAGAEVMSYISSVKAGKQMDASEINDTTDPTKLLKFGIQKYQSTPFDHLTHQPETSDNSQPH